MIQQSKISFSISFLLVVLSFLPISTMGMRTFYSFTSFPAEGGWAFLDSFCYSGGSGKKGGRGTIYWSAVGDIPRGTKLMAYNDVHHSWPALRDHWDDKSCAQRANKTYTVFQIDLEKEPTGHRQQIESYPRFWFYALSSCSTSGEHKMDLNLHMINDGGWWNKEFSRDEQGLLPMYIALSSIGLLMLIVYLIQCVWLWRKTNLHLLVKINIGIIAFWVVTCALRWSNYAYYASNGFDIWGVLPLGFVCNAISKVLYLLVALLVADGWAISSNRVRNRFSLITALGVIITAYLVLFIIAEVLGSSAYHQWYIDTIPGIILACLHFLIVGYLIFVCVLSFRKETEKYKKIFYVGWTVVMTAYFLSLPLIVFISFGIDKWDRRITIEAMEASFYTFILLVLEICLWPSIADRFFQVTSPKSFLGSQEDDYDEL
eukprot:gb/GECH01013098.1/.p1 GENE.gb/GECH01013098.1/~~gb/GECH01013098.1/.p1  ORF type:complete len:431 (+),score=28.84 gb/GECH01013098.1/:1-1293(+)